MFDFSGQVVLVAGASGNLGLAVARAFLQAGATLALLDREPHRLADLFPDLASSPAHLLIGSVDVGETASVEQAIRTVLERFPRIDVLANTVGGYRAGTPVHEATLEAWDSMFHLNARTAFVLSRAVVPQMLHQGSGKIIHVAARAGLQGGAKAAAYSGSKSAVIRLVESMAAELRNEGISVNCVVPSTIDTPQNRQAMPNADHSRWVAPEAIADVFLFLASAASMAIHGAAIPVYGKS